MKALSKNIMVLEKIEKDYGNLDNFGNKEKYKVIQVGWSFAYNYLWWVGVNICKKVLC